MIIQEEDDQGRRSLREEFDSVTAELTITSQDSPIIGNIVQGQPTTPKMLIFRG